MDDDKGLGSTHLHVDVSADLALGTSPLGEGVGDCCRIPESFGKPKVVFVIEYVSTWSVREFVGRYIFHSSSVEQSN